MLDINPEFLEMRMKFLRLLDSKYPLHPWVNLFVEQADIDQLFRAFNLDCTCGSRGLCFICRCRSEYIRKTTMEDRIESGKMPGRLSKEF